MKNVIQHIILILMRLKWLCKTPMRTRNGWRKIMRTTTWWRRIKQTHLRATAAVPTSDKGRTASGRDWANHGSQPPRRRHKRIHTTWLACAQPGSPAAQIWPIHWNVYLKLPKFAVRMATDDRDQSSHPNRVRIKMHLYLLKKPIEKCIVGVPFLRVVGLSSELQVCEYE